MAEERDRKRWAANDARIEQAGFVDWQAQRVRDEDMPIRDAFAAAPRDQAASVIASFMQFCLPPKTYGDVRRFKSGYYRMVATVWRLAPAMLEPCRTDAEVARRLGISAQAFDRHLDKVDLLLSGRVKSRKGGNVKSVNVKTERVLPRPPGPVEVPHEA